MRRTSRFRALMNRRAGVLVPGTPNPLFARVIEDLGFEAIYLSGAGVANMQFGLPDVGLTTASEIAAATRAVTDVVELPVIVDADTGYGNALNTYRTVRQLERAGAAAIQLEDQVFPKKCGHFAGKGVIPIGEMVQKVRAAVDSRTDGDLMIIARTDAVAVEGIDSAIERARAYVEAGADMTFVEAVTSLEDMACVARELSVPQVANIVFGGKTPDPGGAAFEEMGFGMVLYANAALQAAIHAAKSVLGSLKDTRSLEASAGQLTSFADRQQVVRKTEWDALEDRYKV
jgi:2-methylisocitrate lyase-like PEP mutase family enzyme